MGGPRLTDSNSMPDPHAPDTSSERLSHRLRMEKALSDALRIIYSASNPQFVDVVRVLGPATGVDHAYVAILEDDACHVAQYVEWHDDSVAERSYSPFGPDLSSCKLIYQQLASGLSVVIQDVEMLPSDCEHVNAPLAQAHVRSCLSVPLRSPVDGLLGFVGFDNDESPRAWSDEDISLLSAAADALSLALQQAKSTRQLEESRRAYKTLLNNIPGMAYRCLNDGYWTMQFVSDGCLTLTGYSPHDLLSNRVISFEDIIHPDDRTLVRDAVNQALESTRPFSLVYRIRTASAREKWVSEQGVGIYDPNGALVALEGIIIDFTERLHTEQALAVTLQTWTDVFENIPTPFFIYQFDLPDHLTLLDANAAAQEMFRFHIDDLRGKRLRDISSEIFDTPVVAQILNVCVTGRTWHCDNVRYVDSRIEGYFNIRAFKLPGERVGVAVENVTEQTHAQHLLRVSEENYRTIFDAVNDAIVIHDSRTGAVVDANDKACQLYGLDLKQLRKVTVGDFSLGAPPYSTADALDWIHKAANAPQLFEWMARHSSGRVFPVEVNLTFANVLGDDRVVAAVRDISERKRLQEQLLHAQKMEAVGRLAGGVAHDFNNLLAVILGYGELAAMRLSPDDPVYADIEEVRKAAERAAALTRQLLAFSRKQVMQPIFLVLNRVIVDIESMLSRLIGEHIEITTRLEQDLGGIMADQGQLQQVVMNLAINARDAMPSGGRIIIETANVNFDVSFVSSYSTIRPGAYVMLAVSDTGVGMDRDTAQRAFEPFFTTKPEGKGTGLGLATVYGIVSQSSGHVFVYSAPGRGTSIKLYFPRVDPPPPAPERAPRKPASSRAATILLAEDEDVVREFLTRVLEMEGHKVLQASSGEEALSIAASASRSIDLLITDVLMPKMNGRQLALALAESRPGLKVIYTSGYTDNAIVHAGMLEEGMLYLQKPFTIDALTSLVARALSL